MLKYIGAYNLPYAMHPFLVTLPLTVLVIVVVSLMTEQSAQERKVALKISEVLARKSDEPTTGSDYVAPVVIIILSLAMMALLFWMFS